MKVVVVRHPLSRFVSAWAQKFQTKGEFDLHREEWLRKWPKLNDYLVSGGMTSHRIGFAEFLDFFQTWTSPQKFNPHWSLAGEACAVCSRPYQWVVKEETIDSGKGFLINKILLKRLEVRVVNSSSKQQKGLIFLKMNKTKLLTRFDIFNRPL